MLRLLGIRLLAMAPLLLVVSFLIYSLIVLVPGGPEVALAGSNPTPEKIEMVRERLGLNEPFIVQYWTWLTGAIGGDLGTSFVTGQSVWSAIVDGFPVTLSLVVLTLLIAAVLGLALGLAAALRPGSWIDRIATVIASLFMSLPYFWVGMMLVLIFAIDLRVLPAIGYVSFTESPGDWLAHLIIPAFALAIVPVAVVARQTRASVTGVLTEDYVRTAEAKGLRPVRLLVKHVLKNAAVPVVTAFGVEANRLIGATVVMEQLFALPGVGKLTYFSVFSRDFPMVQGILLITAILIMLVNLTVDVSYGYFNPKIKAS
ncbi:ABC transporter permease [Spongiactinospora sp. TRM90649]|uniref:ABC transporter permease n=1 Tax=Spongiactinospora sp. TRM90649 TaxID=3031114 RepID=UPI0023F88115|nr:ABC transporter permease [Spongiactinospora sp. TRM90649]MDF5754333.1 ABC transporter permease [Spongiactinospora sp. TRM90649]